ncbi:MAG: glycerol-3-phosphate acyltransferase, partial [Chloroflexota bacterium]
MDAFLYGASVVIAYLIGSLSPGLLIGKLVFRVDIRKYGSGSSGATNVYRNLGRAPAAAVVLADVLKPGGWVHLPIVC